MRTLGDFIRGRKGTVSALSLAVVVAVPVVFAVTHQGFPVSTAELDARTVWVSNESEASAGRVNRPIRELDGSVQPETAQFEIMQDGADVFIHNLQEGSLARVDPAFNVLEGVADVPDDATASYGGGLIALNRTSDGKVWAIRSDQPLEAKEDQPLIELGEGGIAVVGPTGALFAYSPSESTLYSYAPATVEPVESSLIDPRTGDEVLELTAVGDKPVLLVQGTTTLVLPGGEVYELPRAGLRLQQPGPEADSVVVATGTGLVEVPLGSGDSRTFGADVSSPAKSALDVAAPVRLGDCIYGAWASAQREAHRCGDADAVVNEIEQPTDGGELVFRVNRSVIVLNNIRNGDTWLPHDDFAVVDNWEDVVPEQKDAGDGDGEASEESFEEEIAQRTEENSPPVANPDTIGARLGRSTLLQVLDNDTDPDGDILTISSISAVDESLGVVELVDGGRALQFTPTAVTGAIPARYTVSDGRGGVAEASLTIAVTPDDQNSGPVQQRVTSVNIEAGQSLSYNVLADWRDPDGDEVFLKAASTAGGDVVSRTPDGLVNFTHTTAELGQKVIDVLVSDGRLETPGTLIFNVKEPGELAPIGVPDFATTFVNDTVTVAPLANDRSPSGEALALVSVDVKGQSVSATAILGTGEIAVLAGVAGTYYLEYTVGAGAKTSKGLLRVDVLEDPENPLPPIAVRDVAYLRPGQSVDLGVLQNDVSPSGRVIGVQSVDVPIEARSVTVEVLKNTLLRVSASEALGSTGSFSFSYTISDGLNEATATVVVVPVPPLATNQPPIAVDDFVTVRAGDIARVAVLDNDVHPDGARMHVDPAFSVPLEAGDGFAFVSEDHVRYQAPTEPGTYRLSYTVADDFRQLTAATIHFTVTPVDEQANRPPVPQNLEARVFAGSNFQIQIPLAGIDPDGDSTTLTNVASAPLGGRIVAQGNDWLRYEAYADSPGTDEFRYEVSDAFGAVGQGTIRIAVIPPPADALPPAAVGDSVSVRPDKVASVAVLVNDSDPSGFPLSLSKRLVQVPDGIEARVVESQVVVTAAEEGIFAIQYEVSNGHGGTDVGNLLVTVDENAPLLPPVAIDHVVQTEDAAGNSTVDVDVREGAQNPGGLVADLEVGLAGPNESFGRVLDDGRVTVTLGDSRRVVAYTLTNADGLTATAFVVVPRKVSSNWAPPPYLRTDLAEQTVRDGESREWKLADLVVVPSGTAPRLVGPEFVTANKSDGEPPYVDEQTLGFTPEEGYSGPGSITFLVSDADDNQGYVTLPITIVGADPPKVAPVFATSTIEVVAAESKSLDLRAATDHPDPRVKSQLRYDELSGATSGITANISGDTLSVAAARGTTGQTATLTFRVSGGDVPEIQATVRVVVVSASEPLPQLQDDERLTQRPRPESVDALANDWNARAAKGPLEIVDAVIEDNGGASGASVSHSKTSVSLVPPSGFVGTISVRYTVEDDTGDPSRRVSARIQYVYRDVPGNDPLCVTPPQFGDRQITVTISCAPTNNNAEIDEYQVTRTPGGVTQTCDFNVPCVFTGLVNGTTYSFTARAHNVLGWGQTWSIGSETPYGVPQPPSTGMTADYNALYLYWSPADDGSGGVSRYDWSVPGLTSGTQGTPAQPLTIGMPPDSEGNYEFYVTACNRAGCSAAAHGGPVWKPKTPPPPPTMLSPAYRVGNANVDGNPATPGSYVEIRYINIPPGDYSICATASAGIRWWHAYAGSGNCATISTNEALGYHSGRNEPFGWVVPDSANNQWVRITIAELGIYDVYLPVPQN